MTLGWPKPGSPCLVQDQPGPVIAARQAQGLGQGESAQENKRQLYFIDDFARPVNRPRAGALN
jgi:hypothetical protein